jgi:Fe-S cluster assembly protein SufD
MKTAEVNPNVVSPYLYPGLIENRLVFVDGERVDTQTSRIDGAALTLESSKKDGMTEVVVAAADQSAVVHPVRLLFLTTPGTSESVAVKVVVKAGLSARFGVIVDRIGLGDGERRTDVDVRLAANACLRYLDLRRGSEGSSLISKSLFRLESHASLDAFTFVEGGKLDVSDVVVEFAGEHAFASFKGLTLLAGDSRAQSRIIADHAVPHGTSRQFFKNILAGHSRAELNSLVAIRAGAVKSDTRQLLQSLLLSDDALAQVRPELRIDCDDVSAQHGATVGRIEKDELFYMRSRGLSESLARYVLMMGFADEILSEIEPAQIRAVLHALVKTRLEETLKFSGAE